MRMWSIAPRLLCDQHLLGEHVECHKLAGSIDAGHSLDGYIEQNIIAPRRIGERHDELASELTRRGMDHDSPLDQPNDAPAGYVDRIAAQRDLASRCVDCAHRLATDPGSQAVMG